MIWGWLVLKTSYWCPLHVYRVHCQYGLKCLLISYLEMCLQDWSVLWICSKVSLWSPVRGGGVCTLVVSGVIAFTDALVLLWVWVLGPSAGDAVIELMRMLVASASFPGTSTNHDRWSTALFHALVIHLKLILYVANSSDYQFTLLLAFFPLRNLWKGLWSLCTTMSDPWR